MGGMTPGHVLVALLMLAVEIAVVCGLGVAVSALAGRPLFSIVVTYLAVAGLVIGTLIAFALGSGVARGTVMTNEPQFQDYQPEVQQTVPITGCVGPLREVPAVRTERVAWLLAMNPFVVVADAIPYPDRAANEYGFGGGAIESISQGARYALAGPEKTYTCANGQPQPGYLSQTTPLWPLGLGLHLALTGLMLWLGWRLLRTPARKLARGTRIA